MDAKDLIEHKGIYRCKPGTFLMSKQSGGRYTWQYYLRRCLYDASFANQVGEAFWSLFPYDGFVLGACEAAGVPIACAIQAKGREKGYDVPILSIKKEPKKYGLSNFTEGPLYMDRPVMLVDDIAGSQGTLLRAEAFLKFRGMKMYDSYFCVVNKAGKNVEPHPVYLTNSRLVTLFTSDDFSHGWKSYVAKYGKEPCFGEYL